MNLAFIEKRIKEQHEYIKEIEGKINLPITRKIEITESAKSQLYYFINLKNNYDKDNQKRSGEQSGTLHGW